MSRPIPNFGAMLRLLFADRAAGALPGRDVDWKIDGRKRIRDGVVLGGYLTDFEIQSIAGGMPVEEVVWPQFRHVIDEFFDRIDNKLRRASDEVIWLKRPTLADDDGAVVRLDLEHNRWSFYFRAYFHAPGVEPTMIEGGAIEYVRAPGT